MAQRRARSSLVQRSVSLPAVVLAPSHLGGVEPQVVAADMVVLADLGATEAGKEALRLVRAGAAQAERNRVIDAAHLIAGV